MSFITNQSKTLALKLASLFKVLIVDSLLAIVYNFDYGGTIENEIQLFFSVIYVYLIYSFFFNIFYWIKTKACFTFCHQLLQKSIILVGTIFFIFKLLLNSCQYVSTHFKTRPKRESSMSQVLFHNDKNINVIWNLSLTHKNQRRYNELGYLFE